MFHVIERLGSKDESVKDVLQSVEMYIIIIITVVVCRLNYLNVILYYGNWLYFRYSDWFPLIHYLFKTIDLKRCINLVYQSLYTILSNVNHNDKLMQAKIIIYFC